MVWRDSSKLCGTWPSTFVQVLVASFILFAYHMRASSRQLETCNFWSGTCCGHSRHVHIRDRHTGSFRCSAGLLRGSGISGCLFSVGSLHSTKHCMCPPPSRTASQGAACATAVLAALHGAGRGSAEAQTLRSCPTEHCRGSQAIIRWRDIPSGSLHRLTHVSFHTVLKTRGLSQALLQGVAGLV